MTQKEKGKVTTLARLSGTRKGHFTPSSPNQPPHLSCIRSAALLDSRVADRRSGFLQRKKRRDISYTYVLMRTVCACGYPAWKRQESNPGDISHTFASSGSHGVGWHPSRSIIRRASGLSFAEQRRFKPSRARRRSGCSCFTVTTPAGTVICKSEGVSEVCREQRRGEEEQMRIRAEGWKSR